MKMKIFFKEFSQRVWAPSVHVWAHYQPLRSRIYSSQDSIWTFHRKSGDPTRNGCPWCELGKGKCDLSAEIILEISFKRYGFFSFGLIFLVEGQGVLQATLTLNGLVGGVLLGLFSLGILFKRANVKVKLICFQTLITLNWNIDYREHSTVDFCPSFASQSLELHRKLSTLMFRCWNRLLTNVIAFITSPCIRRNCNQTQIMLIKLSKSLSKMDGSIVWLKSATCTIRWLEHFWQSSLVSCSQSCRIFSSDSKSSTWRQFTMSTNLTILISHQSHSRPAANSHHLSITLHAMFQIRRCASKSTSKTLCRTRICICHIQTAI